MERKINHCYTFSLSITVALGCMLMGVGFSYFNALTKTLYRHYKYHDKLVIENEDLFNSIVSGLIPFGATFGSILIMPFVKYGRWLALVTICITNIVGVGLTMIFNIFMLILGRLIVGMCIGA